MLATPALAAGCVPSCRGCHHRGLSRAASHAQKRQWLHRALAAWQPRIAALNAAPVELTQGYRERVRLAARWTDDTWRIGLQSRAQVVSIPDCPQHSERIRQSLKLISKALPAPPEFPLRYYCQSAAQIALVVKRNDPPPSDWLDGPLRARLRELGVDALWLNLFPAAGRNTFNPRGWKLLWGEARSRDPGGLAYGPASFQQLIPALYEKALATAGDFLGPGADDCVIDCYSGTGASLRRWTASARLTLGVESSAEAVECARQNAPQALVLRGRCEHRIPQMTQYVERFEPARRRAYLNPPRNGVEPRLRQWLADIARPIRIAYLACSATSQARDLFYLERSGYRVCAIHPFDFFPGTEHVETLALLQRIDPSVPDHRDADERAGTR